MTMIPDDYDSSKAVDYHYGRFPPAALDLPRLIAPLARAQDAVSRYDQMLLSLPDSELLLAPMRHNEAVISSRMEGTISTVDEVMIYEAAPKMTASPTPAAMPLRSSSTRKRCAARKRPWRPASRSMKG